MCESRHLFIVSRGHASLYHDLVDRFQDDPNVRVILDRRQAATPPTGAPGVTERRQQHHVDHELRARSHVILTLPGCPEHSDPS